MLLTTKCYGWHKWHWSWAKASRFYEQLRSMVDIKESRSGAKGCRCHTQVWVVDHMKDFRLWVEGSRWYEQLKVVDDMSDSRSWALAYIYYKQFRVVVDMNNFGLWTQGSRCFEQLKVINCSRLWMTWMTPGRDHRALDVINYSWC